MSAPGFKLEWDVRIPMRDDVQLSAALYLPAHGSEAAPCLCAITPYTVHRNHHRASYFASRGFPFLVVDVRGRGNSDGAFQPFHDANDAYDIIEWIGRQTFCNGKVGMFSGSYEGFTQWAAVSAVPEHLKTIVPAMAAAPGIDVPIRSNIFDCYLIRWLTAVSNRTYQENIQADEIYWRSVFQSWYISGRPFNELDRFAGNPSPIFQSWLAQPMQSKHWDRLRPDEEVFSKIDIPILTLTGCYDGDQPGALHYYGQHLRHATPAAAAKHFLIIGPWDHSGTLAPRAEAGGVEFGPAAVIDMLALHCEWYRWAMADGPKPSFLKKNVTYYLSGTEEWRHADSLESVTTKTWSLRLASTSNPDDVFRPGQLGDASTGGPDSYIFDPQDTRLAELEILVDPESKTDDRMIQAGTGRQLVYLTAPFQADTTVAGFFKLEAWLSIDQPDTDFSARVYELGLDGRAILLSQDRLRARYRECLRSEALIATSEPLLYRFQGFSFIARLLRKGHRLRLVVGPADSIYSQRNFNGGGCVAAESIDDARAVKVRLFHDAHHPSTLFVPLNDGACEDV